ncbi:MAG TPA: hypothetical protein VFW03_01430 [Gemmatimonadaceae bacterium]|nr:hypothetical protein [Gemmatimonadaceae bacterium]
MIQPVRTIGIAASCLLFGAGAASAQRGGGALPRIVSAPAAPASAGSMGVPRYANPAAGPTAPRGGNLPRLENRAGAYRAGPGFRHGVMGAAPGQPLGSGRSRPRQGGYTLWGAGHGCSRNCFVGGVGGHHGRFLGSFVVGFPFWGAVVWPYFDYGYYESAYAEAAEQSSEPTHTGSKLIVVGGGTTSGGDALTIETLGDSVRLSWLGANRPVREVKLFVADSAHRELATRSASPMAPTATFEVSTLSAPVAFAGVAVTFADGAMTTTTIPYLRR